MKRTLALVMTLFMLTMLTVSGFAGSKDGLVRPSIFVRPAAAVENDITGFETFVTAAFTKKNTPAVVMTAEEDADYILESVIVTKEESTGSKIARCLFAYCVGMEGNNTSSVRLINKATQEVVWAYNVKKGGHRNFQSSAEAIAKHLGNFIKKNQNMFFSR